jgi:hypothetical protein
VARLVRIPRHLLHITLDQLVEHGVPETARDRLRSLIADLPRVPTAELSAQLIGPSEETLPCLAVLARHVGQGLRDHNLTFAHDRERLATERGKLIFMDGVELGAVIADGDDRLVRDTVLFVINAIPSVVDLLVRREAAGLASFLTTAEPIPELAHWRIVQL